MKYVWLAENTREEESHNLSKEAKAEICYLNPPNAWDKQLFQEQTEQARWTVSETLAIFCR